MISVFQHNILKSNDTHIYPTFIILLVSDDNVREKNDSRDYNITTCYSLRLLSRRYLRSRKKNIRFIR